MERSWRAAVLLFWAIAIFSGSAAAGTIRILVQSSPLAGSQYYALSTVWSEIRVGDALSLRREPKNRYDPNAIRVEWKGRQLGYVPRKENGPIAAALDRGEALEARVSRLRDSGNPWQRVEFEVFFVL
ncbi:MAG: HIRAN domain-containing protein [Betaproteobacteria bacterium]|nr:HIRAN domain-containing protein [Betaproteobacteria bacterium]